MSRKGYKVLIFRFGLDPRHGSSKGWVEQVLMSLFVGLVGTTNPCIDLSKY